MCVPLNAFGYRSKGSTVTCGVLHRPVSLSASELCIYTDSIDQCHASWETLIKGMIPDGGGEEWRTEGQRSVRDVGMRVSWHEGDMSEVLPHSG